MLAHRAKNLFVGMAAVIVALGFVTGIAIVWKKGADERKTVAIQSPTGWTFEEESRENEDLKQREETSKANIAGDTSSPWARVDLAEVYYKQGKFQEMKAPIEEGLLKYPYHPWLLNMYGLACLNTGDQEGAEVFFKAALVSAKKLTSEDAPRVIHDGIPPREGDVPGLIPVIETNLELASRDT